MTHWIEISQFCVNICIYSTVVVSHFRVQSLTNIHHRAGRQSRGAGRRRRAGAHNFGHTFSQSNLSRVSTIPCGVNTSHNDESSDEE